MTCGTFLGMTEYIVMRTLAVNPPRRISSTLGLALLSGATYAAVLLPLSPAWVAFFAGIVIALNSALWGDLLIEGHYDAWLSEAQITRLQEFLKLRPFLKSRLHELVTLYLLFVIGAYVVAFFHLWSALSPTGAAFAWITGWGWIWDGQRLG